MGPIVNMKVAAVLEQKLNQHQYAMYFNCMGRGMGIF